MDSDTGPRKAMDEKPADMADIEAENEVKRLRIENIYLKQALQRDSSYLDFLSPVHVVQSKRNSLSARGSRKKDYDPEDIQLALSTEKKFFEGNKLMVYFPDASFEEQEVLRCDKNIESVTFITQKHPRYCTIVVDPDVDVAKLIEKINHTPFDNGFLSAKLLPPSIVNDKRPINPCVLYVGNIPMNPKISSQVIKSMFVKSRKIDISTNRKSPFKFLHAHYQTVHDAIYDFERLVNITISNQSLDVHFFRLNEKAVKNNDDNEDHDSESTTVDSSTRQTTMSPASSQERDNSVFNQAIMDGLIRIKSSREDSNEASVRPDSSVKQEPGQGDVKTGILCEQSNFIDSQSNENNCYGSRNSTEDEYGDSSESAVTGSGIAGTADDDDEEDEDEVTNSYGARSNNIMFLPFGSADDDDDDDDDSDYST